jgi:hypothetical protein
MNLLGFEASLARADDRRARKRPEGNVEMPDDTSGPEPYERAVREASLRQPRIKLSGRDELSNQ